MSRPNVLHNSLMRSDQNRKTFTVLKPIFVVESILGPDRLYLCEFGRCIKIFIRFIALTVILNVTITIIITQEFRHHITVILVVIVHAVEYIGFIFFSITSGKSVNRFFNEIDIFDSNICNEYVAKTRKENNIFIAVIILYNVFTIISFLIPKLYSEHFLPHIQVQLPPSLIHNIELFIQSYIVLMVYYRVLSINKYIDKELGNDIDKNCEKINAKLENILKWYRILCNAMLHLNNGIKWQVLWTYY